MRGFAAQISNCNPKSAKLNSRLPLSLISYSEEGTFALSNQQARPY